MVDLDADHLRHAFGHGNGDMNGGLAPIGREEIISAREDETTVRRAARLVEIAELRRRQGAPILRVSRKAFGVGRRMPIARHVG